MQTANIHWTRRVTASMAWWCVFLSLSGLASGTLAWLLVYVLDARFGIGRDEGSFLLALTLLAVIRPIERAAGSAAGKIRVRR